MKKYRIITLAVIVAMITATASILLYSIRQTYISSQYNNASELASFKNTTLASEINTYIEMYRKNMLTVTDALDYIISEKDTKEVNWYIQKLSIRDKSIIYRIADIDGNMKMLSSENKISIGNTPFFRASIKGTVAFDTYTERRNSTNRNYIVFSYPICANNINKPTSVLCGFIDFDNIINSVSFDINDVQIMITDKDNNHIYSSSSDYLSDKMQPLEIAVINPNYSANTLFGNDDNITSTLHYKDKSYSQFITKSSLSDNYMNIYISRSYKSVLPADNSYMTSLITVICVYFLLLIIASTVFLYPIFKDIRKRNLQESQSLMYANMSHELRTPLNTIIGISEILARSPLSEGQLKQIAYITDSGKNLLTMINDLLDFSKLGSNKFELNVESYNLEDIIYDTTTVASVRLTDKPIDYLVYVSSYVPKQLVGDVVRVRQLMNNVISNAVKYTQKGQIVTTIDCEHLSADKVRLIISVEDTGIGIKKENINSIFENYTRFDGNTNKNIEGTGLGMPIAKKFATLMGGDITVDSIYQKGSTFTISIIQEVVDKTPLLPEYSTEESRKKILILEKSQLLSAHYSLCLEDAYADFYITDDNYSFSELLSTNKYDFILADPDTISMLREEMGDSEDTSLISLIRSTSFTGTDGPTIFIPLFSIEIHAYLTGTTLPERHHTPANTLTIRTMPEKHILIVDDNAMNLQVATGIMEPYKMKISQAASGKSAINLVQTGNYDLILMDHMMPEMDGEETMNAIKELDNGAYASIPIIACTANASHGAEDQFRQMGFSDFISKPLDIFKIHELLYRWLTPSENAETYQYTHGVTAITENVEETADNSHIDFNEGLARIGSMPIYLKTLRNFCDTIPKKKEIINTSFPDDIKTFVIEVHGLKGIAAIVSANELAKQSLALEMMGKNEDIDGIRPLIDDYYKYMEEVRLCAEKFISDHT